MRLELSGAPVTLAADQTRLMQVLGNLIDNALRVTPPGGAVQVSVSRGEAAQLAVEDSGPSIPEEELPGLFERFTQGKDLKGASGLGLAIVTAFVGLHGGRVEAANRAEGGVAFTGRLPG